MYRSIFVWLSILLYSLNVSGNDNPLLIRQTVNGPVEGIEKVSSLGQRYYSFRGIPFAEAPITGKDPYTGEQVDRRFKAPEPLKRRWTELFKAHDFGKICTQTKEDFPVDIKNMGEDCLYLNVHVPSGGLEQKTVLVWIHGGGFKLGDATDLVFGPDFLISQDNIVVTIQYRLGIFGFLNLNFGEYTGNMGLKDQQLALKWVHENIEYFSGNKNEVLLFGQSAGGASVHLHMLNKVSRSYFQRGFASSGEAIYSNQNHMKLIQRCGKFDETDKSIKYLKTESSSGLIKCGSLRVWLPVTESENTKDAFLTKPPAEIYNNLKLDAPKMDIMFSFQAQEDSLDLSSSENSEPLIKENVMETTKFHLSSYGLTPKEYEEALKMLRKAYFSNITNVDVIKRANANLKSDSVFNYEMVKAAALQANVNNIGFKNTFLFRFNVTSNLNLMTTLNKIKSNSANHLDDICYEFHCHCFDKTKRYDKHLDSKDSVYQLIMRSVKIITNFARTGDPSIEGDTPFKSSKSIDQMFCQEVTNELKTSVTSNIRQQIHYDVWHEIEKLRRN